MREIPPFSNDSMSDNELLYRIIYLKKVLAEEYNEKNMKYYRSIYRLCDDNKFEKLKRYREKQLEDTIFTIKARKHLCEKVKLLDNHKNFTWKKLLNL
tara:strand:+ start:170 stop:463 length:294 start_codon:yes stop_codon:yes gene_type:complete